MGNIIAEHLIRWSNRLDEIVWHCVLVYSAAEEGGTVSGDSLVVVTEDS